MRHVWLMTSVVRFPTWVLVMVPVFLLGAGSPAAASDPIDSLEVWSDLPPGETERQLGVALPRRAGESPPATRVAGITMPTLDVFLPEPSRRTGCGVLILPGGGYRYVVVDKEGSEIAQWLNDQGIAAFVLRYRTQDTQQDSQQPTWQRPLQDTQRALRLIRSRSAAWGLDPQRIGIAGLSAGGQTAALALTATQVDDAIGLADYSARPDFGLLLYPWRLVAPGETQLLPQLHIDSKTPPTFLLHTDDDSSSSLGSVLYYAQLKQHQVPAELHVFARGGHGYGLRIDSAEPLAQWPQLAAAWLENQGWNRSPERR